MSEKQEYALQQLAEDWDIDEFMPFIENAQLTDVQKMELIMKARMCRALERIAARVGELSSINGDLDRCNGYLKNLTNALSANSTVGILKTVAKAILADSAESEQGK